MSYDPDRTDEEPQYYLLTNLHTSEDERQDWEVIQLEIKHGLREKGTTTKFFDRNRKITFSRSLGYGTTPPDDSSQPWDQTGSSLNEQAIDDVIDWMFTQSIEIQTLTMSYLDDPQETLLNRIRLQLGLTKQPVERMNNMEVEGAGRPGTLTALILRSLPASRNSLLELARRSHSAERPEAAARQVLRRLIEKGIVQETEGVIKHVS